jgi:hypothetical protein
MIDENLWFCGEPVTHIEHLFFSLVLFFSPKILEVGTHKSLLYLEPLNIYMSAELIVYDKYFSYIHTA